MKAKLSEIGIGILSIIMLYALMIGMFDTKLGVPVATIVLIAMVVMMKISKILGLDKAIDKWLERE